MAEYTIHGGDEGKRRLDILARTVAPGTEQLLKTVGMQPGMDCLDLGCGGGNVTFFIAGLVGPHGQVTGMDMDARKIELATAAAALNGVKNIRFEVQNAYALPATATYDCVYTRFLLSHLSDPETILQNIRRILRPNGLLLVEDTDFSGHFCYPASNAFNRYVALYQQLLQKRGADANLGPKLPGLLKKAGFTNVAFQISHPAHTEDDGKLMAEITFEGISHALLAENLILPDEAQQLHAALVAFRKREDSVMSLPRIFQVWGMSDEVI